MIWFGNLERLFIGPVPAGLPGAAEDKRMQFALERVAEVAPGLTGEPLIQALESTGWVDRRTAERLLPTFCHFDPDQHFCEYLRRLSFRGKGVESEFRAGIRCILQEITGNGTIVERQPDAWLRFAVGDKEGIVLAQPEVGFTVSGRTRETVLAAVEEMPDALILVARTFDRAAAEQLSGILYRTGVPGTLITVNLLLGIRATVLRYGASASKVIELLGRGGTLRSADIAPLGERPTPQRFHISGWNSKSTV